MITLKQRLITPANLLFALALAVNLALPDTDPEAAHPNYATGFLAAVEALNLIGCAAARERRTLNLVKDISAFVFAAAGLWLLATAKFPLLNPVLFPPPGAVFAQIVTDADKIAVNIQSSLGIIVEGFVLGAVPAVALGLFLGWNLRVGHAASRLSSFFASIPPVVYIPYAIALLPTFRASSVFVIVLATFWPVFINTMSGVVNIDSRIIDSARALNVGAPTLLFRVIFPAALPQIFTGLSLGLCFSFILLTSAEMIGANAGLGYYVKNYSDLGDYTRTVAGILVIGAVISLVTYGFDRIQRRALRWKAAD